MKALIFGGIEQVSYESVPDPAILAPTDAIVRILCSGICGSDLHAYHGREVGLDAGTVLGHEFAGEVVSAGSAVRKFRVGDRVASAFSTSCGDCYFCARGLTARCPSGGACFGWVQNGNGLQGAQAQFIRVPLADGTLFPIAGDLTFEEAVLLGDNLATGFFCADMAAVNESGTYAVVGCGTVGLLCVLAARERGATTVIAIDNLPYRRQLALAMGASAGVPPESALGAIQEATAGRGAEAVLEAVGSPPAQQLSMRLLRPGGTLAIVGMHLTPHFAFSPVDAYNLNLTFKTGRCPARYYMDKLGDILSRYRPQLQRLISHRIPLSDGSAAYQLFASRAADCTKILLDPLA